MVITSFQQNKMNRSLYPNIISSVNEKTKIIFFGKSAPKWPFIKGQPEGLIKRGRF